MTTSSISESRPLSGRFHAIMYDPDTEWTSHYPDKFRARRGVMLHAVRQGWSLKDCRVTFLNPGNPGSALWTRGNDGRELGARESLRRLTGDYHAAAALAARQPVYSSGQEVSQELALVRAHVGAATWEGRTGRTDRAVLLGILGRMIEIGSDRINFSERDAALRGGITRNTARASLRRLTEAGIIERTRDTGPDGVSQLAPGPARADLIKVSGVAILTHMNIQPTPGDSYVGQKGNTYDPAHETWLHLGKGAGELWSLLTDDPQGVRELARQAAVSPSTVSRRQLPKLTEHELARKQGSGWVSGKSSPDEVAKVKGWRGNESKTARRRKTVALDRIGYAIRRGHVTVAEAMMAHPGMAGEIGRKFGGLEEIPVLATAS